MNKKGLIKRSVCILLSFALVFGLTSCKKKDEPVPEETTAGTSAQTVEVTAQQQGTPAVKGRLNPLTGVYEEDFDAEGKRPIAVVVENSPQARPQWGISTPDILVEGLAEGGITRMLLFYGDIKQIPKIGPIRSARHDFVEFAECFDAIFVHAGWSIYAKDKIQKEKVDSVNGILGYGDRFFFRDNSRRKLGVEHTGYSDAEHISDTIDYLKYRRDVKSGYENVLKFNGGSDPVKPSEGDCSKVSFTFSYQNDHTLTYDAAKGKYLDSLNGEPRVDDSSAQLEYGNILILSCSVTLMGDSAGCVDMALESSNKGYYISHGGYEKVSWTTTGSALDSKLVITNSGGETLSMNPGTTYIAIVPDSRSSTISFS